MGEPEGNRRLYPATNSKFKNSKFKTKNKSRPTNSTNFHECLSMFSKKEAVFQKKKLFLKKRSCSSKKEAVSQKKKLFLKKRSCFSKKRSCFPKKEAVLSKKEAVSQKKKLFLKKRSCFPKKEAVFQKRKLFLKKRRCFPNAALFHLNFTPFQYILQILISSIKKPNGGIKMKHFLNRTLVMMMLLVLLVPVAFAATGAAFVHGKGDETLANSTVAWNYWTTDMLRASTNNWAVPYVVCHYDGRDYMWVAADAVAGQLYTFITQNNITDLVIDTHSFGGVVIRWIFSNPTWDSRYPPLSMPPAGSTPLRAPQRQRSRRPGRYLIRVMAYLMAGKSP